VRVIKIKLRWGSGERVGQRMSFNQEGGKFGG
jgi:hypothetical protein